jgi:hypothetical protein
MAYSPPVTFTAGTVLTAADLQSNDDALRVYLHEDISTADLQTAAWVDTRHVQPPSYSPILGVQSGVTGFQGSQWAGGVKAAFTFCSSFVTGGARDLDTAQWMVIPGTTMKFDLRKPGTVFFHWWVETLNGPDVVPNIKVTNDNKRLVIVPFHTDFRNDNNVDATYAQECQNCQDGFSSSKGGATYPYNVSGYGQRQGTFRYSVGQAIEVIVGLAHWSQIDRSLVFNWGICAEVYYF